jgi:hypothetical protein
MLVCSSRGEYEKSGGGGEGKEDWAGNGWMMGYE